MKDVMQPLFTKEMIDNCTGTVEECIMKAVEQAMTGETVMVFVSSDAQMRDALDEIDKHRLTAYERRRIAVRCFAGVSINKLNDGQAEQICNNLLHAGVLSKTQMEFGRLPIIEAVKRAVGAVIEL